ncbi:hypothetical protein LINPERPRIM_LOCUS1252 [Linum perenne]
MCLLFDKLEDEDSAKYLNFMPAYQVPDWISEENPQLNRASNVPHPATQPVVDVNLQFNAFDERNASDEPVKVPKKRGIKKINPDPGKFMGILPFSSFHSMEFLFTFSVK